MIDDEPINSQQEISGPDFTELEVSRRVVQLSEESLFDSELVVSVGIKELLSRALRKKLFQIQKLGVIELNRDGQISGIYEECDREELQELLFYGEDVLDRAIGEGLVIGGERVLSRKLAEIERDIQADSLPDSVSFPHEKWMEYWRAESGSDNAIARLFSEPKGRKYHDRSWFHSLYHYSKKNQRCNPLQLHRLQEFIAQNTQAALFLWEEDHETVEEQEKLGNVHDAHTAQLERIGWRNKKKAKKELEERPDKFQLVLYVREDQDSMLFLTLLHLAVEWVKQKYPAFVTNIVVTSYSYGRYPGHAMQSLFLEEKVDYQCPSGDRFVQLQSLGGFVVPFQGNSVENKKYRGVGVEINDFKYDKKFNWREKKTHDPSCLVQFPISSDWHESGRPKLDKSVDVEAFLARNKGAENSDPDGYYDRISRVSQLFLEMLEDVELEVQSWVEEL